MISKELLSEVLEIEEEITHIDFLEKWKSVVYFLNGKNERTINIHELANKCILHFYDDYIFSLNAYEIIVTKICIGKDGEVVYS